MDDLEKAEIVISLPFFALSLLSTAPIQKILSVLTVIPK